MLLESFMTKEASGHLLYHRQAVRIRVVVDEPMFQLKTMPSYR